MKPDTNESKFEPLTSQGATQAMLSAAGVPLGVGRSVARGGILFAACVLFAGNAMAASLECGPSIHEAGRVAQGKDLVSEAVCRNVSDRTVDLSAIHSGCPCLAVVASRQGGLGPGEKVRLQLRLSTDGLTDRVGFPVELAPRSAPPELLFHYEADVRPSVVAVPGYVDLGDWKKGGGRQIILVDTTGGSFGIERAVVARSGVDVVWSSVGLLRVDDKWTVATGKGGVSGYLVTVQAKPGHEGRRSLSDEIQIELSRSVQRNVRIRVVGFSP